MVGIKLIRGQYIFGQRKRCWASGYLFYLNYLVSEKYFLFSATPFLLERCGFKWAIVCRTCWLASVQTASSHPNLCSVSYWDNNCCTMAQRWLDTILNNQSFLALIARKLQPLFATDCNIAINQIIKFYYVHHPDLLPPKGWLSGRAVRYKILML